jgi:hypothetical protein
MVQSRCSQKYLTPGILGVENTPVFVQKAHADSNNLSRYRYSSFCPSVFVSYKAAVILRIRQSSKYPSADVDAKVLKCVCDFRLRLGTAKYKYYVAFHSLTIRHTFIISQMVATPISPAILIF